MRKWYKNLTKILSKLFIAFFSVAIITGIVGLIGSINIKKLQTNNNSMYNDMTVPISTATQMGVLFQETKVATRDMVIADDVNSINAEYEEINKLIGEITTLAGQFSETIVSDETQKAYDDFVAIATRPEIKSTMDTLYQLCLENKDDEAFALIEGPMATASDAEKDAINNMINMKINAANEKSLSNSEIANKSYILIAILTIICFIAALAQGFSLSVFAIANPLNKILNSANSIAEGDLNISLDIDKADEIGQLSKAFTHMADNVNNVMTNINEATEQVSSGAAQVSDSSISLSQGTTEQASSIEQLSQSIEEIASQTKQNAENAKKAKEITKSTEINASNGTKQMEDMLIAMGDINESSNNISKIIKVIDEIAFQTNILALNAAVEAARAGEHGRGFAVVAEEVRNLAARSADAAKETTIMIENSMKKVEDGAKIANVTSEALNNIVGGITKASDLISNIATASNEQAIAVEQVNQGITQISDVVQSTSATSEETASASEELSSQAELLKEQVDTFKLKNSKKLYSEQELQNLNPDVLKMLDNMQSNKTNNPNINININKDSNKKNSKEINLSDSEFGKY